MRHQHEPGSRSYLRDICAVLVVAVFIFPIAWTAFDSVKPSDALYSKDGLVFAFAPTLANYRTIFGQGAAVFDSRQPMIDSSIVAICATVLALVMALPAAFALWRLMPNRRRLFTGITFFAWAMPPIVVISPLFLLYHETGLFDTLAGLILAEAAIHVPFAILLLSSFFDDVPVEVAEAATLDGASEWQVFARIIVPMLRAGIAATAIMLFIFCWTEFFLAVFLTAFTRLAPVHVANMSNALGGSTMAFATAALLPCFVFVLLVQKHMARGFSLGLQR